MDDGAGVGAGDSELLDRVRGGTKSTKSATRTKTDDRRGCGAMSKDEQQKLNEHNKLRTEIKKVKYPAAKATSSPTSKASRPTTRSGSRTRCPTRPTSRPTTCSARSGGRPRPPRPPRRSSSASDGCAGRRAGDVDRRLHAAAPAGQPRRSGAGRALVDRHRRVARARIARLAALRARRADGGAVERSAHSDRPVSRSHDPPRVRQRRRDRHALAELAGGARISRSSSSRTRTGRPTSASTSATSAGKTGCCARRSRP